MNQRNYQKELDAVLERLEREGGKKILVLHACCAPCSSYVLEYLSGYFDIVLFFYNPNITDQSEYEKRKLELKRLVKETVYRNPVIIYEAEHDSTVFFEMAKGLEQEPECGRRCFRCYELRLQKTAELAKQMRADYFCTTLSISPHKRADKLMEIGERLGETYGVAYLPSDFKKRNGYQRSIELSKEYGLYRQNYCGCVYSREAAQREQREECR